MNSRKIAHGATILLLVLFAIGFIANGKYDCKFNLESVWYGVGIFVASRSAKHITDSKFNSKQGEKPDAD